MAASLLIWLLLWSAMRFWSEGHPGPPGLFASYLPESCEQVMLVVSPRQTSIPAQLWLLERSPGDSRWRMARGPLDVTLGRNGLAWGRGEHRSGAPKGFPMKREGDGCSPAGVFRIPFAFGLVDETETTRLRLPYLKLTQDIIGVDDPNSRHYNQVVNATEVTRDWESNEAMSRHTKLYRWGAFIDQNPKRIPGGGSCIFLHLWPGPGRSTAGCTAMAEADLKQVLEWLDPERDPRLVQTLASW